MGITTRQRILIVDDDERLAGLVKEYLEGEGFAVDVIGDGSAAVPVVLRGGADLVVLDVMLPGIDGFEICRRVRVGYRGMILMLTARGEEIDEVLGLELGADDYLSKPVRPRLLLTRIRALLRRSERAMEGEAIDLGGLRLEPGKRTVLKGEEEIELTSGEFDLLQFLAERRGKTVTRDEIYQGLRGIDYDGLDRSIDLCVTRLRRKLNDDGKHPRWIKSIRGVGYLLASER